jgi:YVTN family beta-propeller protein
MRTIQRRSFGRFAAFALISTVLSLPAAGAASSQSARSAPHRPTLYVSNERGGDVVALDAQSGEILARIPVGKRPRGLRVSPDGKHLYVALSGSPIAGPGVDESKLPPPDKRADGIGVVDLATHRLLKIFPSGSDPETFDISADGKTLYIANEDVMRLSALDLDTGTLKGGAKIGVEPEGVTLSPDGRHVYVACEGTSNVFVIDRTTLTEAGRITTQPRPRNVAFSRDGKLGFVTNEVGVSLTVFDVATNAVRKVLPLAAADSPARPMAMATTPDGASLYVSTGRGGGIVEVDINALTVKRTINNVGQRPWGLALSADGKTAYTANGPGGDVSFIDLATGKVTQRVKVGDGPWGLALAN